MQDYRLRIGMRFIKQGREYLIEQRLSDKEIRIKDVAYNTSSPKPMRELIDELFTGKLELIGEDDTRSKLKEKLRRSRITDISQLDDNDPLKLEIVRRFHYVREMLKAQPRARTKDGLTPIILDTSRIIGDPNPPAWVTLNRWFRAFEAAGRDIRSLAPAHKARGNSKEKISGKVPTKLTLEDYEKAQVVSIIVDRAIRTKYLTREQPSVQSAHEMVVYRISEENLYREPHDQLPTPHISSLYKTIKKLDRYEVDSKRFGKKYADEKHRANKQGPRPSRPLERVEADHTKVDMMVIDDQTKLPLGRPWLTTIIDVYTKMILGIYLSFHRPGALSVMQCLLHAIKPKSYLKTIYPLVISDWPTYGIPENIWVDNADEFYSSHFLDACLQLGIEPNYSPLGCPWFRATIERWFGTLNKSLLHELPGTTFSNIFDKKDYDPQKHAVIPLRVLLEIIHVWIADYYHKRFHRGIQDIPYRRWTEAIAQDPPNLPPALSELDILLGFIAHRSVGRSGIELFTLFYNSQELSLIRRTLEVGEKVMLKYDPTDISIIYVWDKRNQRFVPVPALDQEYTRKLSVWQHLVIKRYARQFVKDHVDIVALSQAKETIRKIVERERLFTRSIAGKQKIAHYLNIGQPSYDKDLQANVSIGDDEQAIPKELEHSSPQLLLANNNFAGVSNDETARRNTKSQQHNFKLDASTTEFDCPMADSTSQEDEGWRADYNLPMGGESGRDDDEQ